MAFFLQSCDPGTHTEIYRIYVVLCVDKWSGVDTRYPVLTVNPKKSSLYLLQFVRWNAGKRIQVKQILTFQLYRNEATMFPTADLKETAFCFYSGQTRCFISMWLPYMRDIIKSKTQNILDRVDHRPLQDFLIECVGVDEKARLFLQRQCNMFVLPCVDANKCKEMVFNCTPDGI